MVANITPIETAQTEPTPVPSKAILYAKLARVMGKVNRVPKSGENKHFGYTFATASDIYDTIRAALAEEKVAFLVDMVSVEREGKKTKVKFDFTFACGDTGAVKVCQWESEADDTQDKGINKAATFAVKYFLIDTFLISTGDLKDDPDGDAPVEDKKAQTKKQERRIPQPEQSNAPARTEAGQESDAPTLTEADLIAALDGIEHKITTTPGGHARVAIKNKLQKEDAIESVSAKGIKVIDNAIAANWFDTDLKLHAQPH